MTEETETSEEPVITDDSTEWALVREGCWQSQVDPDAFSTDEGTTYTCDSQQGAIVHQSAKKLEDGSIFHFPDGFYGILQKVVGEEDGAPEIKDEDIRIIAWGGTPDKWLVQFEVPTMSTENFFDLVYDGEDDITGIRTYERIKEG